MDGYLRAASKADMDLLFAWANEPLVRKNSFSTETISYEEHKKWFGQLLSNENSRQYIYLYGGEKIGQARLKRLGKMAVISYSICAEKRGMGHGRRLLQLLCSQAKKDFPEIQKLIGEVKSDNIASQRAFESAGFSHEKDYVYEMVLSNEPEYEMKYEG